MKNNEDEEEEGKGGKELEEWEGRGGEEEAVIELLRHRSCDQKVPSSIPRSGISVEVTSQC